MARKFSEFDLVSTPATTQYLIGYDPSAKGIRVLLSSWITWLNGVLGTSFGRALLTATTVAGQRTALGLGDASTKSVGTTAGTVAAGDHTHTFSTVNLTCADDASSHTLTVKKIGTEYVLKLD